MWLTNRLWSGFAAWVEQAARAPQLFVLLFSPMNFYVYLVCSAAGRNAQPIKGPKYRLGEQMLGADNCRSRLEPGAGDASPESPVRGCNLCFSPLIQSRRIIFKTPTLFIKDVIIFITNCSCQVLVCRQPAVGVRGAWLLIHPGFFIHPSSFQKVLFYLHAKSFFWGKGKYLPFCPAWCQGQGCSG